MPRFSELTTRTSDASRPSAANRSSRASLKMRRAGRKSDSAVNQLRLRYATLYGASTMRTMKSTMNTIQIIVLSAARSVDSPRVNCTMMSTAQMIPR